MSQNAKYPQVVWMVPKKEVPPLKKVLVPHVSETAHIGAKRASTSRLAYEPADQGQSLNVDLQKRREVSPPVAQNPLAASDSSSRAPSAEVASGATVWGKPRDPSLGGWNSTTSTSPLAEKSQDRGQSLANADTQKGPDNPTIPPVAPTPAMASTDPSPSSQNGSAGAAGGGRPWGTPPNWTPGEIPDWMRTPAVAAGSTTGAKLVASTTGQQQTPPRPGPTWNVPDPKKGKEADTARESGGRYKKGHSGNLKGRPPRRQRSNTMRQLGYDFMEEYNRETLVGNERVALGVLAIRQLVTAAAKGDLASARIVANLADKFGKVFEAKNKKSIESLDFYEEYIADQGIEPTDRNVAKFMNSLRKKTRKP